MPVTAGTVLTDIRTLADLDSGTATLSDAQILSAVNWAHEHYYDIIIDADEGHFEQVLTAGLVANSAAISPALTTTFRKVDLVEVVDANGDAREVRPLTAKKEKFQLSASGPVTRDSDLFYYLEGNALRIYPTATEASSASIFVTWVPAATSIATTTTLLDVPDRFAKAVALFAINMLDVRLRDGRDPADVLAKVEAELTLSLEGRQRQESRRIQRVYALEDADGLYLGG